MNTTREQKKSKALELMKTLDIYKPYIKAFKDNDTVSLTQSQMSFNNILFICAISKYFY